MQIMCSCAKSQCYSLVLLATVKGRIIFEIITTTEELIDPAEQCMHNMYISRECYVQSKPEAENLFISFACPRLQ